MPGWKANIYKAGLNTIYYTGLHHLLAPVAEGRGLVFMLHQVRPEERHDFAPNRVLQVTPDFLDSVLKQVRAAGIDIVSLDEAHARLTGGSGKRFACFTLDDGYRDNLDHALPVFRRHDAPFTVYVATDFPDGAAEIWWVALERILAENKEVELEIGGTAHRYASATLDEKYSAWNAIYAILRRIDEEEQRAAMRRMSGRYGVDMFDICRDQSLSWDQVRELGADPLATIGAHTVSHFALSKLDAGRALAEMKDGADRLERETGLRPRHFAYPYGDEGSAGPREFKIARELGFKTAVTTRKGLVFDEHKDHLTALPRVSLNGDYQAGHYTEVYLSGAPFALWNRFKKVNAV